MQLWAFTNWSTYNSATIHLFFSVVPSDGPDTVFRSANPPRRFFSADSIVLDSFDGQLSPVILELEKHGYIFVMYYSHWSLSSTEARDEFEEAASVMQFKVCIVYR